MMNDNNIGTVTAITTVTANDNVNDKGSSSCTHTSKTAFPTAHAIAFPPNVLKCKSPVKDLAISV